MAAPMSKNVELGFVEKVKNWRLLSHFFPSKVGGKPAWLSLDPLPSCEDLQCGQCKKPLVFLAQLYAEVSEVDSKHANSFHRSLLVFICNDPKCYVGAQPAKHVRVFRSQLARKNDFYGSRPPNMPKEDASFSWSADFPSAHDFTKLCGVCGARGPKKCAKCNLIAYCSRDHQIVDWKGGHKERCPQAQLANTTLDNKTKHASHPYLFPEYEIVRETEDYEDTTEKSEEEKMKEYKDLTSKLQPKESGESQFTEKQLERTAKEDTADSMVFENFKDRINHEPEQVLRYSRGGQPLWVSSEGFPLAKDIPACKCGAARQFEFQIMPHMLHHLGVDDLEESIDWGTLVIYTCKDTCDISNNYHEEFAWQQNFSAESI